MKRNSFVSLVIVLCLALILAVGFLQADVSSEAEPTRLEAVVASGLLSAKLHLSDHERKSPISASSSDLEKGKQYYQEQCSFCHGEPTGKPAMLANAFSPRPPQFVTNPTKRETYERLFNTARHTMECDASVRKSVRGGCVAHCTVSRYVEVEGPPESLKD